LINGVHAIIFSEDAESVRAFFRDVLGLPSVDAGGGWLIFALPPAELAAHPDGGEGRHELYLMCDDIRATVEEPREEPAGVFRRLREGLSRSATFAIQRSAMMYETCGGSE
jgi:catechol 2,3-dioxygenase-like lactoylglutathione lyase family enzyme